MNTNNNYLKETTYGWDNFSKIIVFIGCIFCLLAAYEAFLGLLMILYAFWRSRSRNIMRRIREERALLKFLNGIYCIVYNIKYHRMSLEILGLKNKKKYKKCPRCGKPVLLKNSVKNNLILCPKCSLKFKAK
ncbi:hypothetical protein ACYUJ6_11015 [Clostridium sp. JNZ X4-2]